MRCRRVQVWLRVNPPDSLDSLPEAIGRHVAECPACRQVWLRQAQLVRALGHLSAPDTPRSLRPRVMEAIRARPARVPVWRRAAPALAAAAVLLILVLGRRAPGPPPALLVTVAELRPGTYVQQHAMLAAWDPLNDPTAMYAQSTLAWRDEVRDGHFPGSR